MYAKGRLAIPFEDPAELLYLRFGMDDIVDQQLAPAAVRVPGQSVNRGSLSEPEDVLFHQEGLYNGLGVVEFFVRDVPTPVTGEHGSNAVFFMRHKPLEDNYSHSEVCCDKTEQRKGDFKPSNSVKLKFKADLCKLIRAERIRIPAAKNRL